MIPASAAPPAPATIGPATIGPATIGPATIGPVTIGLASATVLLGLGWRLSWLATRLDRAHARAERTWASLDAALVRRAQRSLEVITVEGVDPATALLVGDAAGRALDGGLDHHQREHAETVLSRVLQASLSTEVTAEQHRVQLARRLHNDAVATARSLRSRRTVRLFRLAGRATEPVPFEIA